MNFTMPTYSRPIAREDCLPQSRFDVGAWLHTNWGDRCCDQRSYGSALPYRQLFCWPAIQALAKRKAMSAGPSLMVPPRRGCIGTIASTEPTSYLHEQGMRVHSNISTASRGSNAQNDTTGEQVSQTPPVTPQPEYEQSDTTAEQPAEDFVARWVDLPKSVDLNARERASGSNGYAAEQAAENRREQLPPAWANVSAANGDVGQNTGTQTNFGSISLAGAAILALLLISEALMRLARTSAWILLRFNLRTRSRDRSQDYEPAVEAVQHDAISEIETKVEPLSRTETGVDDLRRLLQRADTGLRPSRSFAPSRSVHRHEHANHARAHSAFVRLKSRSFSGMNWVPL